jgi:antitoxin HicB
MEYGRVWQECKEVDELSGYTSAEYAVIPERSGSGEWGVGSGVWALRRLPCVSGGIDTFHFSGIMIGTIDSGCKGVACMKPLIYKILLTEEPEGGYTVRVPMLPGCITYGETIEDAKQMAREAIAVYIESLAAHNEEIPTEEHTFETTVLLEQHA